MLSVLTTTGGGLALLLGVTALVRGTEAALGLAGPWVGLVEVTLVGPGLARLRRGALVGGPGATVGLRLSKVNLAGLGLVGLGLWVTLPGSSLLLRVVETLVALGTLPEPGLVLGGASVGGGLSELVGDTRP